LAAEPYTLSHSKTLPTESAASSRPRRLAGLIVCLAAFCVGLQSLAHALRWPLDLTANRGVGQVLLYLIVLAAVRTFGTRIWADPDRPSLRRYARHTGTALRGFGLLAGATLAAQLSLYGLIGASGAAHWSLHPLTAAIVTQTATALLIVVVLTATEEAIFRGFVFNYLRGNSARPALGRAVFGSALVFTLAHHFHEPLAWFNGRDAALFVGLMLLGTLLATTYQATGSLACSVGVHTALLWLDVFRKRTDLIQWPQHTWWLGVNNDLRTAPIIWAFLMALTAGVWAARRPLHRLCQIE